MTAEFRFREEAALRIYLHAMELSAQGRPVRFHEDLAGIAASESGKLIDELRGRTDTERLLIAAAALREGLREAYRIFGGPSGKLAREGRILGACEAFWETVGSEP